jgi:hypothetical protein
MYDEINYNSRSSLEKKLRLIADGESLGLTPEEALIYGVEDADWHPEDEYDDTENEEDEYE